MRNKVHNPECGGAYCTDARGEVRVLPLGDGANLILCHDCYNHEISYRKMRNKELPPDAHYSLPEWLRLATFDAGK